MKTVYAVFLMSAMHVLVLRSILVEPAAGPPPPVACPALVAPALPAAELAVARQQAAAEYAARQCMVTVARGDYDAFLHQLGWVRR